MYWNLEVGFRSLWQTFWYLKSDAFQWRTYVHMCRTDPLSWRSQSQIWGPKFNHLFVFSSCQLLQECKLVLNVYWTCWTTDEFKKIEKVGWWMKMELVEISSAPLVPNFIHFPLFYIFLNLSLRINFPTHGGFFHWPTCPNCPTSSICPSLNPHSFHLKDYSYLTSAMHVLFCVFMFGTRSIIWIQFFFPQFNFECHTLINIHALAIPTTWWSCTCMYWDMSCNPNTLESMRVQTNE
jgi:hypothetical protein